jgi:DNA-binding winged helix-turn-helix (wHTH) protein
MRSSIFRLNSPVPTSYFAPPVPVMAPMNIVVAMVVPIMAGASRGSPDETRKIFRGFSALDYRRRAPYYGGSVIEFPPYRLDPRAGCVWRGTHPVPLRPKAWELLHYLVERPGALVTKDELHAAIWGDTVVSDDTLTRTLAELRLALRDDARTPRIIETVHRRGFRFIAQLHGSSGENHTAASPDVPESMPEAGTTTLVGREAELARLWALFRQASGGERQVVFVEGEAGIGKSALVEAFLDAVRAASQPVLIGYGQCVEQYGEREPYMPVLEALERMSREPEGERLLSALRSAAPSWLAQMPSLQTPTDAERLRRWHAETTSHRMPREFAGLVDAISVDSPMILVLEDLHWSDQGTVDLVSVLAQRPERARTMLIGTCRPAQAAALDHPIQQVLMLLRARRRSAEINLEYLSQNDVATYLARRFRGASVVDELASAVHAHTDGNPLFMIMLVDHLLARGWLVEDRTVWRLTVPRVAIEQEMPDSLRELIEGQLRFVSPAERNVLEVASVAGLAFDVPAVAAGFGGAPGEVDVLCDRLCRVQRWLRHVGTSTWPDGTLAARYVFGHPQYQLALYDGLPPGRRATLHQQIGEGIEAGYATRAAEVSGELARHFQGCHDPRRAIVYLEQAARRGYDRHALGDVVACLEPALALLRDLPDTPEHVRDELRLRQLYAVALSQTAGYAADALLRNLERAQDLCGRLADHAALLDVLCGLILLHSNGGRLAQAEQIAEQLPKLAEDLGPSAVLQSDFMRGALALWSGNLSAAESLLVGALSSPASLEEGDRPYGVNPVVSARSFEGLRRWIVGDSAGARVMQKEALALSEQQLRPFSIAHATTFSAVLLVLEEDWAEAARLATMGIDLADEYGFPRWRGTALVVRGRALVELGQGDRGLVEIREGVEELRQSGLSLGNSLLLSLLAAACLRLEKLDEGLVAAAAGLTHCRDTGERLFETELWRLRGALIERRARPGKRARGAAVLEAEECFDQARAVARTQGAHMLGQRASREV